MECKIGKILTWIWDLILVSIYFPFSMIKSLTNQRVRLVCILMNSIIPYGIPLTSEGRRDRLPRVRVVESLEIHNFLGLVWVGLLQFTHTFPFLEFRPLWFFP